MSLILDRIILQAHAAAVQIPPGIPGQNATAKSIIVGAINWSLGIAGAVAVIYLVVGAFFYITAAGDTEKLEKAKKTIRNAIIGVVILLLAGVIVTELINILGPGTSGGGPNTGGGTQNTGGGAQNTQNPGASASTPDGPPSTPSEEGICTVSFPGGARPQTMNSTKGSCDLALAQCQQQNPTQQSGCSARWDRINRTSNNVGCTITDPDGGVQNFPNMSANDCTQVQANCTAAQGGISTGRSCTSTWTPPQ